MPTFNIVQVAEPGCPVLRDAAMTPYTFTDGRTAAAEAKRLSQQLGIKLAAKVVIDRHWRDREYRRFDDGEYIHLPWWTTDWWHEARNRNGDIDSLHFAHVSQKSGAMVAYTASEEDGSKDKQTLIKPSKYLERFCSRSLQSYGLDPRTVAARFAAQFAPAELKLASTAEDIQRVYEEGPESCMSGETERYISRRAGIHPVTVYAAGDLQVAYLEAKAEDEESGETGEAVIIARALVWPERKTHCRIYGDIHRMQAALKAAGYTFGAPVGAKIKRIPIPGMSDRFVAPYIDAGSSQGGGALVVYDKGKHFIIGRKAASPEAYFACNSTEGLTSRSARGVQCTHCDEYVEAGAHHNVRISCDEDDYRAVCGNCIGDRDQFWQSAVSGYFYDRETVRPVEMDDGSLWTTEDFARYGAVCARSGLKCSKETMVRMYNGVLWSRQSYRSYGFMCDGTQGHYPRDLMVSTVFGRVCRDYARQHCFQCNECGGQETVVNRTEVDGICLCRNCGYKRWRAIYAANTMSSAMFSTTTTT